MLRIKIIDVKELTYIEEEAVINKALYELQCKGFNIVDLKYRVNSVIIEYIDEDYNGKD